MDFAKVNEEPESNINPDLLKERNTATFPTLELTNLIDGDKAATEKRRRTCMHRNVCYFRSRVGRFFDGHC